MSLLELRVEIPAPTAAIADGVLLEHEADEWSVFEDVLAPRAWLLGMGGDAGKLWRRWSELEPVLAAAGVTPMAAPAMKELGEADWRESYKAHFHPWQFGGLHWVPEWQRASYVVPPGEVALWLDPGMAFGTGNHETTRLCVERLVAWVRQHGLGGRVVDAGCGSGILALSAALLGVPSIIGFDNDPEAIQVSEANATLNGLGGRVRFEVADLASGLAGREAELVLANIQADVLTRHAHELTAAVVRGGALVLSGILAEENARVAAAFAGLVPDWRIDQRVQGEWSDLMLERPA